MKFRINRETSGLPAKEERDIYSLLYSLVFFPLKETVVKGKKTINEKKGRKSFIWKAWHLYKMYAHWSKRFANKANGIKKMS